MRIAWATDLHLEFVEAGERLSFYEQVATENVDAMIISGDIGTAQNVAALLHELKQQVKCRVLFVLGNHDFYGGSIPEVRDSVAALAATSEKLTYLSYSNSVPVAPGVCVAGHDGWGDARLGDHAYSTLVLSDFHLIHELAAAQSRERLGETLRSLGDEAATHLGKVLPAALAEHQQVIVVTHVPPFREVCFHGSRPSDANDLPYFACKATGEAILNTARQFPHREILVLCGHTHAAAEARVAPNVLAIAGAAEYGQPTIQRIFAAPIELGWESTTQ